MTQLELREKDVIFEELQDMATELTEVERSESWIHSKAVTHY